MQGFSSRADCSIMMYRIACSGIGMQYDAQQQENDKGLNNVTHTDSYHAVQMTIQIWWDEKVSEGCIFND